MAYFSAVSHLPLCGATEEVAWHHLLMPAFQEQCVLKTSAILPCQDLYPLANPAHHLIRLECAAAWQVQTWLGEPSERGVPNSSTRGVMGPSGPISGPLGFWAAPGAWGGPAAQGDSASQRLCLYCSAVHCQHTLPRGAWRTPLGRGLPPCPAPCRARCRGLLALCGASSIFARTSF